MQPLFTWAWITCVLSTAPCSTAEDPGLWICCAGRLEHYVPHEGDLVFYESPSLLWRLVDALAFTKPPDHCAIVVKLPDGALRLLECGPDSVPRVFLLDVPTRIRCYHGTVWVRRLRCPLTPEQSACLTDFALQQEGKKYALVRFVLQITPLRARGPIKTKIFGANFMNRRRWICSDITAAACIAAGLLDPHHVKSNTTYPLDLFNDKLHDLSPLWDAPVRVVPNP